MKLMLAVIFFYVALGLFARRLGLREHVVIAGAATVMSALYYLFSYRFM